MGKKGSSAPPPPNPVLTSAAQTGTNVGTAIANNTMQLVDQVTPYGNLTNRVVGYQNYTDPFTGRSYQIPRYKQTISLNDQQQQTLDASQKSQTDLAELAAERSDFLRGYLPNTEAITDEIDSKLFDLGSKRLDPRFERQEDALRTRLANQGIAPGSEAFNREIELMGNQRNDAYNQLALQGRGQALAEINQPINQITALLSGSQVSNPNVNAQTPGAIPTTDNAGIINDNYNQRLNIWQQNQASRNSLMGGLFGAGATILSGGLF